MIICDGKIDWGAIEPRIMPHVMDNIHDGDTYYYDEHTCPTNWTGDILTVISQGDDDPHGFATFCRRMNAPLGLTEDGHMKHGYDGGLWTVLFPETAQK